MAQAQLTVVLAEGTTLEEGKAIRDAIAQLRGVEGVTVGTTGAADRVAYQRMKQRTLAAMTDALNALDEQGVDSGERSAAQAGR